MSATSFQRARKLAAKAEKVTEEAVEPEEAKVKVKGKGKK